MPDSSLISQIIASAGAGTCILVILFVTGLVWTKHSVDDIKRDRDQAVVRAEKAEAKLDEALKFTTERTIPLLESFVSSTATLIPILQGLVRSGIPPGEEPPRDHGRRR